MPVPGGGQCPEEMRHEGQMTLLRLWPVKESRGAGHVLGIGKCWEWEVLAPQPKRVGIQGQQDEGHEQLWASWGPKPAASGAPAGGDGRGARCRLCRRRSGQDSSTGHFPKRASHPYS